MRCGSRQTSCPRCTTSISPIPIRFKAMELAALDIIALGHGSGGFSEKGFRSMDRQISGILAALDMAGAV